MSIDRVDSPRSSKHDPTDLLRVDQNITPNV
jgi:hypothetical protein